MLRFIAQLETPNALYLLPYCTLCSLSKHYDELCPICPLYICTTLFYCMCTACLKQSLMYQQCHYSSFLYVYSITLRKYNFDYWTNSALSSLLHHNLTFTFQHVDGRQVGLEPRQSVITGGIHHWRSHY